MTRVRWGVVGDIGLAGFLLLIGVVSLPHLRVWENQSRPVDAWAVGLVIVAAASMGLRRWPLVSFGMATVATSVYLALGYPYGPILFSVAVATYTVARRVRRRVAVIAAIVALPFLLVHVLNDADVFGGLWGLLPGSAWIVVPFSAGLARRLAVEAAHRKSAEAERRVLDDERLRLSSEVHDIVGHGLAAIQMQADIARHVRDSKPEQADVALDAISQTSAEALAELRATLAEIGPDGATYQRESLAPTPGLHRLRDLCARMRESGIDVDLEISGQRRVLPPAVDVATYRVVQESLTNVAKHAAERHATVQVRYSPDVVEIEVVSTTAQTGEFTDGFGIAGMRRRVHDVGGSIAIEAADRQFRVTASFRD